MGAKIVKTTIEYIEERDINTPKSIIASFKIDNKYKLDEAWVVLTASRFANKLREWFKISGFNESSK